MEEPTFRTTHFRQTLATSFMKMDMCVVDLPLVSIIGTKHSVASVLALDNFENGIQ